MVFQLIGQAKLDAIISGNFSYLETGDNLITTEGEYANVDAGISKILLDNPANQKMQKLINLRLLLTQA